MGSLLSRNLRPPVCLAVSYTATLDAIAGIVLIGSDLKMARVTAKWRITGVADQKPFGDGTLNQFVGETMGNRSLPAPIIFVPAPSPPEPTLRIGSHAHP